MGEISEIKTGPFGSTLHADDYVSEGVPIITTEHFKTGSLPQSVSGLPQVSEVDYKRLSAYTLNNGDIVFSRVGSVDINALVTPFQRNWLFSGRVLRVRPGIDVLPQFLHTRLETESIKNDICARAVGQTMPSINTEILKATQLVLPTSMAEQKQIGLYFAKLDHLITLHQRKYDKLQVLKKAMLEKMFPKNGSSVPEIRFKGFTDAWEQRKLGDCFTERCESMPDGELISVTINDGIKKFSELGRHDNSNDDKSKYKKVCAGDIAYNSMRMWQGASGCSPYEGIVSPAYTVLTPNSGVNSKCMAYQFKLPATIHTFKINSQGITSDNWNLKFPALSKIEIYVSPYEQEQAKIAAYFANLDNLITLHQRELEKLQNIKKSMLEKMFV